MNRKAISYQIDEICDRFEAMCRDGLGPNIAELLPLVSDANRSELFVELVQLDLHYRCLAGEKCTAADYLNDFGEFESEITSLFESLGQEHQKTKEDAACISEEPTIAPDEGTANVGEEATIAPGDPHSPPPTVAPAHQHNRQIGNYSVESELGRGGMGVVYQVRHREGGESIALKLLPTVSGTSLHRFKQEFRALAEISHANLIGLHSLESDGQFWFITMELLRGAKSFLEFVRPHGSLNEARLRIALPQLFAGTKALHDHGVIHRDLKPSNVMVDADGRVVLLDFGLVSDKRRQHLTLTEQGLSGTPAYMAPEIVAKGEVTEAHDWYACGVMLYEALCGAQPFRGDMLEMLTLKHETDAPPPPNSDSLPQDLVELSMALLSRDPTERPGAEQVFELLACETSTTSVQTTFELTARHDQLAELRDCRRWFEQQRKPLAIFIRGRSGEGKSVLAEAFLGQIRADGAFALISGRCYDRESVPFKALDSLIDGLCSYLRQLPDVEAASLMPREVSLLAKVFPVLLRVDVVAKMPEMRVDQLDEQQVRTRAFAALRELLGRIGDRTPIAAFIDDLQWGDADSAEVLQEVLQPPLAPQVMLVGTYRSDEAQGSAFLRKWDEFQHDGEAVVDQRDVSVGPFTVEECRDIVAKFLDTETGRDGLQLTPDQIQDQAKLLFEETGGNPYLISEAVNSFDRDSQSFQRANLQKVVAAKLEQLPDKAKAVLDLVAVSGQPIAVTEVFHAMDEEGVDNTALTGLRNMRLLKVIQSDTATVVDTYHDRIRETVLEGIAPALSRKSHRRLAEAIETQLDCPTEQQLAAMCQGHSNAPASLRAAGRLFDLSYHCDAAGLTEKAFGYALLAAEQAGSQYAPEVVAEQLAIAKRNAGDAGNDLRFRIGRDRSDALHLLGLYQDADQELAETEQWSSSHLEFAELALIKGFNEHYQGRLNNATAVYEEALSRLGVPVPKSTMGLVWGMAKEATIAAVRKLIGYKPKPTDDQSEKTIINLLNRVGQPYVFQSTLPALWSSAKTVNRVEALPAGRASGFAIGQYGMFKIMMFGASDRAKQSLDEALDVAEKAGDLWLVGVVNNCRGVGMYAAGHYQEAAGHFRVAIDAFQRTGDQWMRILAHFHLACCLYGLGQAQEAIEETLKTIRFAKRYGDSRVMCASWLLARITDGDYDFPSLHPHFPDRPDDVMSTTHGRLAQVQYLLHRGNSEQALDVAERAWADVWKWKCFNSHTILILPMMAKVCRVHAQTLATSDQNEHRRLQRRSLLFARWACRAGRFVPSAHALALREAAEAYRAAGNPKQALKLAKKSCRISKEQQAEYEFALSALLQAELEAHLGLSIDQHKLDQARSSVEEMRTSIQGQFELL